MTRSIPWPADPGRKALYSAAATLLAFAEVDWLLPAQHAPLAPALLHALVWLGLALTVLFVLLATAAHGRRGGRGWVS